MRSVSSLIQTAFRSVWALELLLHLKVSAPRSWSRAELVEVMRGSELIVDHSIEGLTRAGLVSVCHAEMIRYQPESDRLAALADQAQREYAKRPDAVRRLIVSGTHRGLAYFADAFRLWRD